MNGDLFVHGEVDALILCRLSKVGNSDIFDTRINLGNDIISDEALLLAITEPHELLLKE